MTDRDRASDSDGLRALLEDAVADVHPDPALDRIRARTQVTPLRRSRPWLLATAGAVAATAATVIGVAVVNRPAPQADPAPDPAAAATSAPSTPAASPTAPPSEQPTDGGSPGPTPSEGPTASQEPAPPAGTVAVPVYFVGDTPAGPRLYREFHAASTEAGSSGLLLAALKLAVRGEAADPDYGSVWPATGIQVVAAEPDAGRVVLAVDGADPTQRPAGTTEDQARLAVQQLVYTAHAVLQERAPVAFTDAGGQPLASLLGIDVSSQVQAAPALEVQAPVWVSTPQDGDQVGRTFTVEGRGAFFEANVSWQLLQRGQVVADGFATAQECCTLSPYSFDITADPGEYVLRVYAADVSGGEGPGEQEDTKRITVR